MDRRNSEGYSDPTAHKALSNIARETKQMQQQTKLLFRPIVYICSPLAGEMERNQENARRYCRFAVAQGYIPIAPHLLLPQFLDDTNPAERELAMQMNMALLSKCAELWVFGDHISKGMAVEIGKAKRKKQPIRYFTTECKEESR